jgi:hypothetical protein
MLPEFGSEYAMGIDVNMRDPVEVAHEAAVEAEPRHIAGELQRLLGQKLVAYALGDRHPKTVGRYARGEREPEDAALARLVDLYTVALVLQSGRASGDSWIKQWMLGSNMRLGGKAPAQVFHDGHAQRVMGAAKAFVSGR